MDCEQAANFISARVDGEIAGEEEAALDAHLAGCAACRAAMELAVAQDVAMVRAFGERRDAAAALAQRVAAEVTTTTTPHAGLRGGGMRWFGWLTAAAAGFGVAVILMRPHTPVVTQPIVSVQQPSSEVVAQLALVTGEVFTCPSGKEAWQPTSPGAALSPGTKVRTADAAKCELALSGGSKLRLNSGTELELASGGDVQLSGGQIWSAVPQQAGPLRIAAGDARVTTPAVTQVDVARVANAATVTVVDGCAQVNGHGQPTPTSVRAGESLRIGGTEQRSMACEPISDPLKATRWLDDLLVLLPAENPELQNRVDALLGRMVDERKDAAEPGPVERDVRARGGAWSAAMARYVAGHQSAAGAADVAKRRMGAALLADVAPTSCVGDLIPLLADEDSEVRYHVAAALNRLTGQTLGFSPDRCAAAPRDAAPTEAWQAWWARNRTRYAAQR